MGIIGEMIEKKIGLLTIKSDIAEVMEKLLVTGNIKHIPELLLQNEQVDRLLKECDDIIDEVIEEEISYEEVIDESQYSYNEIYLMAQVCLAEAEGEIRIQRIKQILGS